MVYIYTLTYTAEKIDAPALPLSAMILEILLNVTSFSAMVIGLLYKFFGTLGNIDVTYTVEIRLNYKKWGKNIMESNLYFISSI